MMILGLLLILTFLFGVIVGVGTIIAIAMHIDKKERKDGNKKKEE